MREDMDRRFKQVDKRFEQVDGRFEQVDKRFEQVAECFREVRRQLVRLADDHGRERVDALCAEALDLNRLSSGFLRQRLKNGRGPDRPRPEPDCYQRREVVVDPPV